MVITNTENLEHCKQIAERLDAIAAGRCYRCPECGDLVTLEENEHICPTCGAEIDTEEPFTMWDYFEDIYDIEYRVDAQKNYKSVSLMVACGGPNIYIDTAERAVLLYWWGESARYNLLSSTAEAIDEVFEELFNN